MNITLYEPIKRECAGLPGVSSLSSKDGNEEILNAFPEFVFSKGEMEINIGKGVQNLGYNWDEVQLVSSKIKNGWPVYNFSHRYTGQTIVVNEAPLQVTAYKYLYVHELDTIKVTNATEIDIYESQGRMGYMFVNKIDFMTEIAKHFPSILNDICKWWNNVGEHQFVNGKSAVHFL